MLTRFAWKIRSSMERRRVVSQIGQIFAQLMVEEQNGPGALDPSIWLTWVTRVLEAPQPFVLTEIDGEYTFIPPLVDA